MKIKKKQSGFTLVESMVIVAILGILATVAAPSLLAWLPNMRLNSAARTLYAYIQKGKLDAIKRGVCTGIQFTTVTFPATGGSYIYFIDDGAGGGIACNGQQDGGEVLLETVSVNDSSTSLITAAFGGGGGAPDICFTAKGTICGSQSGSIVMQNNSRWKRITIVAAGAARIESSSDGVNWIQ